MSFLAGKKTYIAAGALMVVAAAGYWFGYLDGTSAAGLVATGLAFYGLRDANARYAKLIIAALEKAKEQQHSAKK